MLYNTAILFSFAVVALFFYGDEQGRFAVSDEACAKQFERSLMQQVTVRLLS